MRNGKINAAFIIASSLVFVLACNLGSPASSQHQPATSTLCNHELYPVRAGASWTYASSGSPDGNFTYTDTITNVRADGFTLNSQFDGLTRTQEWLCETGGLKALQLGGGPSAVITTQNAAAELTTPDVTGISLPAQIPIGTQWQYSLTMQGATAMPGDQHAKSTGVFTSTMQAIGIEAITVPAGSFEAVKIHVKSSMQVSAEFQGMQVPISINASSMVWYAPGVGFIKSIENSDFGGTPYTSTTELQSYIIP
jgi:hypothetical protein